ncbi:MAG: DEAD/DEAH box helicase [Acidimicrobiaceae bacterium]|nr:DEAD/DEAH box helicase [Acidimicrobiia bacterium]MCY4493205.1 DEAD/DEAH box helicase [Acidimicrobiaceae bacterium]
MPTDLLNALDAASRIEDAYRSYLLSTFRPNQERLAREFELGIRDATLTRGPYLEASAPFEHGRSVRELVREGVLSRLFLRFTEDTFPIDRPLHVHQETAIRKAVKRRNLIVSTGTGSGKTEAFLLPILNGLFGEIETGTIRQSGVRALLLYPMNALANDQIKRLRRLLTSFPEITFGRYVGETEDTKRSAEDAFRTRYPAEPKIRNELLSREELQATPPALLLTNYAMLEYLLLRPADSPFFDGHNAKSWRHLVLDEAHAYDGAQGTEIAALIRRVKDRIHGSKTGRLQCFATSATMGKGREDYPALLDFATQIFNERFEWIDDDPDRQDIVEATRRSLIHGESTFRLPQNQFDSLQQNFRQGKSSSQLAEIILTHAPNLCARENEPPEAYLHRVLREEETVISVQEQLTGGARSIKALAADVFGDSGGSNDLVKLVDLAVAAKGHSSDTPLLPARYHFWVGSLDGGYLCQHPEHPSGLNRLKLERHKQCPDCRRQGRQSHMVELGVCRSCGAEYAVGKIVSTGFGEQFQLLSRRDKPDYLLIGATNSDDLVEEDADALSARLLGKEEKSELTRQWFDVEKGVLSDQRDPNRRSHQISVTTITLADKREQLHRCATCSSSRRDDVVSRFRTGMDAPLSVIATALYQSLPPSTDENQIEEIGEGRKLLSFADSRQDAAFAAPSLKRTYERAVVRGLVLQAIRDLRDRYGADPRFDDLVEEVQRLAEGTLLNQDDGRTSNRKQVEHWMAREALALDRRQSLDGLGLVDIRLALPRRHRAPISLQEIGLRETESIDLVLMLFDTLRLGGAVSVPDGVDIRHEMFAPRNVRISMRERGSSPGVIAWLPGAHSTNRRVDNLRKALDQRNLDADPKDVLTNLWDELSAPSGVWSRLLIPTSDSRDGVTFSLNHEQLEFRLATAENVPLQCNSCRTIWWRSVAGVCPSWRCDGKLERADPSAIDANHYARLYRDLEAIGMSVEEHTAQWAPDKASKIQDEFVRGKLNVLSCSTTFEMGVDVGDVQAVLMRNVPPRASNYVQRAGRAGRRQNSAALVVTMAQLRSHDQTYFADPTPMINGHISPPTIHLNNTPILRRHAHSVAFAAYQRHIVDLGGEPATKVGEFFGTLSANCGVDALRAWLHTKPSYLRESLGRILPETVADNLAIKRWGWVSALYDRDESEPTFGWMRRAYEDMEEDSRVLEDLIAEAYSQQKGGYGDRLKSVKRGLETRQLLGFLASRNILPKYGFPIDVINLELSDAGPRSRELDLDRDLRVAIREYAPAETVVAGGRLWKSEGIRLPPNSERLPEYHWRVCSDCKAFRLQIEGVSHDCPQCGSNKTKRHNGAGKFVTPRHGFVANDVGEPYKRPSRRTGSHIYFGSYQDALPEFAEVPELSDFVTVVARASTQGRIVTINSKGYRFCQWCGRGEEAGVQKHSKTEHDDLRRPGRKCAGRMHFAQLGHEYLTDVLEIQFEGVLRSHYRDRAMNSLLSALLAAVPKLGINRDDVDGTLNSSGLDTPQAMVIFDSVPGGAGFSQRIRKRLPHLFHAAHQLVSNCACQETSSCYGCLRNYHNQFFHDELSRGDAKALLDHMSIAAEFEELQSFSPLLHSPLSDLLGMGAPMPVAEHRTSDWEVQGAVWPEQKVAILLDNDDLRDHQLFADGWIAHHFHDCVPEQLLRVLNDQAAR